MFSELDPSSSGVVVSETASARPVLTFRNFSLRCDPSDPAISFKNVWNWSLLEGKKTVVITTNSFLKYQLVSALAGLVSPISGQILVDGVVGWPVGGEGGLDSKLRISHALNFLVAVYGDCLEKSLVSMDEFWDLLAQIEIHPGLIIRDLSLPQKDYFFLALSVLFSFDLYLIPNTKFLMSKFASPLRPILLKQLGAKTLISTSVNKSFQREFCSDGLVLGALGEVLYAGGLVDAIQWADQNLGKSNSSDSDDEQFGTGLNLLNLDSSDDGMDDFV
ncbi:hypothetical protein [Synechococcus sp. RS9902]|uniref:hypothetical protein n=1 Tax=Synechococcus sp. RS9902 TaxID=221345 RepID=UPI001648AF34|nr:hypothetical protein [Synechococcus sp. RS9902]QNI96751.1 ABC-type polysaccharide efflux transporter/ ATPase component [Synechococcus sp. RS9902]